MILTPLQKLTKNGEDWGKLIVAKGFEKLPKVQNIAKSGHTAPWCVLRCVTCSKIHMSQLALTKIHIIVFCGSVLIKTLFHEILSGGQERISVTKYFDR